MAQRKAITTAQAKAWTKATKTEKAAILDAVVQVTGWHRDHARKMLRRAAAGDPPTPRTPREPVRRYNADVTQALVRCWALLDGIASKRLAAALPRLLAALERLDRLEMSVEARDQLLTMSPATMDRHLQPYRQGLIAANGIAHTKPGSLLKSSIPLKTWAEWNDTEPGFIEIDLVGHEGGDNNGAFHYSLNATDIATGWTENRSIPDRSAKCILAALNHIAAAMPFPLLGVDSDNGSEFINDELFHWCTQHKITFTRSRPGNKNDGCHVEQKNWAVVRTVVGYYRYDTASELLLLNEIWRLQSQLTNYFHPQQKLISKVRTGAKVSRKHDKATTPFHRAIDHPSMTPERILALKRTYSLINPAATQRQIEALTAQLFTLATSKAQTGAPAPVTKRARSREAMNRPTRAS